jgi:hypothetical protein
MPQRLEVPTGKHPLSRLYEWSPSDKGFYLKTADSLRDAFIDAYSHRNEIMTPGALAAGASIADDVLAVDFSGLNGGFGFGDGAPTTFSPSSGADVDMLTDAGVLDAIFSDGTDATSTTLAVADSTRVALIYANSDGAGGALATFKALAIIMVDGEEWTDSVPSTIQVQRALEASTGVHDGVTAWVWMAHATWNVTEGPVGHLAITMNVNNKLGL